MNPRPRVTAAVYEHTPRRLAPPEDRAQARAVARFVQTLDEPDNMFIALVLISTAFPDIKLDTALAGWVFRTRLAEPERVLQ